jgi:serine/threonine protein kinase/Tfp pilus assembly protein PilF
MTENTSLQDPSVEALVSQVVDEFMARVEKGERPDIADYAARHPAIANLLRQVLPALELVRFSAPGTEAAAPLTGCLGDYSIVREVGRGSMGVVYEAEQISLSRRVALKVLPFAAALDAQRLQRFKTEALAAAHLHHQNIVPVYAVGCERGVHYYAMQFIDGQTMAAVIESHAGQPFEADERAEKGQAGKPDLQTADTAPVAALSTHRSALGGPHAKPFFREAARLGVQAAEALEHAHQVGIVHRDIKPANLLLDQRGNLWIADFGLAHVQGDVRLTMTGDLVGTMRYMSPEAALGRGPVDQRTDVYSLGATLYELLAHEPALGGKDRGELLQQIAHKDPRRLRKVNREIPAELETIVHKALAKEPEGRYATAQALADDLRRYLDDKPIQARPPTMWDQAKKWSRRQRPVVVSVLVSGVLLLLLSVVGLAVHNLQITRERDAKTAALAAAESQRRQAEANLHRALDAIERMLGQVSDKDLVRVPSLDKVRLKMSEDALDLCRQLQEAGHHDPAVRHYTARAYDLAGNLKFWLGQTAAGDDATRKALSIYEELVQEFPSSVAYRAGWAQACFRRACNLRLAARYQEAEPCFQQAIRLWNDLVSEQPSASDFQEKQAHTVLELGYLLWAMDRYPEAHTRYQEALKLVGPLVANRAGQGAELQISIHNSLGVLQKTTGRWPEAEQSFRNALELSEKYHAIGSVQDARAHVHLGVVLWQLGRPAEAEPHLRQAVRLREDYGAISPSPSNRQELLLTWRHWAQWLAWVGRGPEAEETFQKVLQAEEELAKQHPAWADYSVGLALSRRLLANLYRDTGHPEKAEPLYRQALGFAEADAALHPDDPSRQSHLAGTADEFGRLLFAQASLPEARGAFQKAGTAFTQAVRLSPNRHDVHYQLARFQADCPDDRFRDPEQALANAEKAVALAPQAAACWNVLGLACYRAGRRQEAVKALDQALSLRNGGNSFDWFVLAMAHARLGDKTQARTWYDRAVGWMDKHQPGNVELLRFRAEAKKELASVEA